MSQFSGKSIAVTCACLIGFAHAGYAYEEWSVPNVTAPTVIEPPALEVQFQHQFLGHIKGDKMFSRLFGVGDGADAYIGLRSIIWSGAQVGVSYDNMQTVQQSRNEFTVDAAYAAAIPLIFTHLQIGAQYFSYESFRSFPAKRNDNFFILGTISNDPLFGRVVAMVNGGYDFDKGTSGLGLGLDVKVSQLFDLFGDYFPRIDKMDNPVAPGQPLHAAFSFGGKITTAGHQFFVFIGNSTEIGPRHLMQGASDNFLRVGFLISRLFSFS
jgi:hypothetical protein